MAHAAEVQTLSPIHKDPLDRTLIAEARVEGLTLVSRDQQLGRYHVPFVRVDTLARKLPADRWTRLTVLDGEKGPLEVEAVSTRVKARHLRRIGPEERLLVIRTVGPKPDWTYSLSNAPPETTLIELVRVRSSRHRVEEVF